MALAISPHREDIQTHAYQPPLRSRPSPPTANSLSRAGQKFFFKAMRLPDVSATLDFSQKLKLRKRLDDLKTAHTTGLLLEAKAQAQPCLDLAAQSGLVAIVELRITSDELMGRRGWKSAMSRNRAHGAYLQSASGAGRLHYRLRGQAGRASRGRA